MPLIDSDAHVVETDHTWAYLEPSEQKFRPRLIRPGGDDMTEYWLVDGKLRGLARRVVTADGFTALSRQSGRNMSTPQEAREMENVATRVAHMDELGVTVQVLYPTIFIQQVTDRAEIEVALCRSYNQWVASLCADHLDRLRWNCVLPLLSMDDALEQLEWSRQRGAVGVFMRPIEGSRLLHDPYFYPLYDAVSRKNMTIGVHVGNANTQEVDLLAQRNTNGFWRFRLALIGACHSLLMSEVPNQFPSLRFHFAEAASQWIPYVMKDLERRWPARKASPFPTDALARCHMFVSCETDDDLAHVIEHAGEDSLVIGTDYGHDDQSTEIDAMLKLKDNCGLTEQQYWKIVDQNPRQLWAL